MIQEIQWFFKKYYIEPILYKTGYNIFNTITYGILFAVVIYGLYKILKKYKIKIDWNFIKGVSPFIFLASIWHVFDDAGVVRSYFLLTPLLPMIIFAVSLTLLWMSKKLEKRIKQPYWKTWAFTGYTFVVLSLIPLNYTNYYGAGIIIGIFVMWFAGIETVSKYIKSFIFNPENKMVLYAHIFDATTTFSTLQFFPNYGEQHVLANVLINLFGPVGIYVLKLPVILLVIYLLGKKQTEETTFLKLAIIILGLGPGFRNFLRLLVGV